MRRPVSGPVSRPARWQLLAAAGLLLASGAAAAIDLRAALERLTERPERDILPVEQAFAPALVAGADGAPALRFEVREGYYLYRDRIEIAIDGTPLPARAQWPPGRPVADDFYGQVAVYDTDVELALPVQPGTGTLAVRFQGCAAGRFCYPPHEIEFRLPEAAATP